MFVSKAAIESFVQKKGRSFPYSHVRGTRQGFHPKWLLTTSKGNDNGILFRSSNLFLLRTSCVPGEVVQSLIISEAALPLPVDFEDVADCMHWWGRTISGQWYIEVLGLLNEYLTPGGFHGSLPTKERLFHDCIFQHVFKKIRDYYGYGEKTFEIVSHWEVFYTRMFSQMHQFFDMAVMSIREVDYLLEQSFINAPVPVAAVPVVAPFVASNSGVMAEIVISDDED
jgi:hypothetical protein